jgi:hypothetical protein
LILFTTSLAPGGRIAYSRSRIPKDLAKFVVVVVVARLKAKGYTKGEANQADKEEEIIAPDSSSESEDDETNPPSSRPIAIQPSSGQSTATPDTNADTEDELAPSINLHPPRHANAQAPAKKHSECLHASPKEAEEEKAIPRSKKPDNSPLPSLPTTERPSGEATANHPKPVLQPKEEDRGKPTIMTPEEKEKKKKAQARHDLRKREPTTNPGWPHRRPSDTTND